MCLPRTPLGLLLNIREADDRRYIVVANFGGAPTKRWAAEAGGVVRPGDAIGIDGKSVEGRDFSVVRDQLSAHKGKLVYSHLRLLRDEARHHYDPPKVEALKKNQERQERLSRLTRTNRLLRRVGIRVNFDRDTSHLFSQEAKQQQYQQQQYQMQWQQQQLQYQQEQQRHACTPTPLRPVLPKGRGSVFAQIQEKMREHQQQQQQQQQWQQQNPMGILG